MLSRQRRKEIDRYREGDTRERDSNHDREADRERHKERDSSHDREADSKKYFLFILIFILFLFF
tara:strand:+ start:595 stop:786 length:192 start_codon:yes stop_codon:yes gene_type:complete